MSYYPPPSEPWQQQPHGASGYPTGEVVSAEDRNWALAAHVGSFVTGWFALGLVAPLVVLLVRGSASPFVRRHAVESLNFQINALVYFVLFTLLLFLLVGFVLLPAYFIFWVIVTIIGTMRASAGEEYRYPLTVRVIN